MKTSIPLLAAIVAMVLLGFLIAQRGKTGLPRSGTAKAGASAEGTMIDHEADSRVTADTGTKEAKRKRDDDAANRESQAGVLAARLIPMSAKSMAGGEPPTQAEQEEAMNVIEELSHCDSRQLQSIIATVREATGLNERGKAETAAFLLPALARLDPMKALNLYAEMRPLFSGKREEILPPAAFLKTVAETDPGIAAQWYRANRDAVGEDLPEELKTLLEGDGGR